MSDWLFMDDWKYQLFMAILMGLSMFLDLKEILQRIKTLFFIIK